MYFIAGKPYLNPVGLYRLKAYVLQTVGVMQGISTWENISDKKEPKLIQEQKRAAWMSVHSEMQSASTLSVLQDTDGDTDVEDEPTGLEQFPEQDTRQ